MLNTLVSVTRVTRIRGGGEIYILLMYVTQAAYNVDQVL